jgi:hypothetical protein
VFVVVIVPYVASFSGLPFFDCPFGVLLRLLEKIKKKKNLKQTL